MVNLEDVADVVVICRLPLPPDKAMLCGSALLPKHHYINITTLASGIKFQYPAMYRVATIAALIIGRFGPVVIDGDDLSNPKVRGQILKVITQARRQADCLVVEPFESAFSVAGANGGALRLAQNKWKTPSREEGWRRVIDVGWQDYFYGNSKINPR